MSVTYEVRTPLGVPAYTSSTADLAFKWRAERIFEGKFPPKAESLTVWAVEHVSFRRERLLDSPEAVLSAAGLRTGRARNG